MKKTKFGVLVFTLLLTGCDFGGLLNFTSNAPSEESTTVPSVTSEPPATSEDINPDNLYIPVLDGFAEARPVDPVVTYTDSDSPVLAMHNGFTYPAEARVQPNKQYIEFWHPTSKLNIEIFGDPEIFMLMDEHGLYNDSPHGNTNDLYWPVTVRLTVNGRKYIYYEVAMRRKGNRSRMHTFYDHETLDHTDAFSFKLKFNERWDKEVYADYGIQKSWTSSDPDYAARKDRVIMADASGKGGMSKIDLKYNHTEDTSMTMQPFVFSLFQKHGLISQNSTVTTLRMNNKKFGLLTINEPIDKDLMRRYFKKGEDSGDLYKVGWGRKRPPSAEHGEEWAGGFLKYEDIYFTDENDETLIVDSLIGERDKFRDYNPTYDMKELNTKDDHTNLINLMRVLKENENKTPENYKSALEGVVDIQSFANYAAVSYVTGNPDDLRNNGNNYYIYFNPADNRAHFIPYDYDWSMGHCWGVDGQDRANQHMASIPHTHPTTEAQRDGAKGHKQLNRLYWYTINDKSLYPAHEVPYNITMNPAYLLMYEDALRAILAGGYYSTSSFTALNALIHARYGDDLTAEVNRATWTVSDLEIPLLFINKITENISYLAA